MTKSFLQALRSRYGAEDDIATYDPTDFLVGGNVKAGTKNKKWELVGMEKTRTQQSRYDRLFVVVLREENIGVALTEEEAKKTFSVTRHAPLSVSKDPSVSPTGGADQTTGSSGMQDRPPPPSTLPTGPHLNALEAENMSRLEELDLSANPLPLREVGTLLPYFTHLRVLQLSDMPHLLPAVTEDVLRQCSTVASPSCGCPPLCQSESIEKLVLNNVGLTSLSSLLLWIDLPRLAELHLDHNHLSALPLLPVLDVPPDEPMDLHDASGASEIVQTVKVPPLHRRLGMLRELHHILLSRRRGMSTPEDPHRRMGHDGPKATETAKEEIRRNDKKDTASLALDTSLDVSLFSFPSIRILSLANNAFSSWGGETCVPLFTPTEDVEEERNHSREENDAIEHAAAEASAGCMGGKEPSVRGVHPVYVSPSPGIGMTLRHFFPSLEQLFLTDNPLPNIPLPPKSPNTTDTTAPQETRAAYEEAFGFMHTLKLLCLRHIPTMDSTATLDAIRQLSPVLETFRISYSSLLPHWNDTLSRLYVLASLPTVTVLNRGVVREKERLDAEIFYIQCGRRQREKEAEPTACEMEAKGGQRSEEEEARRPTNASSSTPASPHPIRYPLLSALEEKHKDLVLSIYREGVIESVDGVTGGASGSTPFMSMTITLYPENLYANASASNGKKMDRTHAQTVQVPFHLTVGKLKSLVWSLFMVKPENQQLRYQPGGDAGVIDMPILLDNELETLGYFGVTNEGKIGITDTSLR